MSYFGPKHKHRKTKNKPYGSIRVRAWCTCDTYFGCPHIEKRKSMKSRERQKAKKQINEEQD